MHSFVMHHIISPYQWAGNASSPKGSPPYCCGQLFLRRVKQPLLNFTDLHYLKCNSGHQKGYAWSHEFTGRLGSSNLSWYECDRDYQANPDKLVRERVRDLRMTTSLGAWPYPAVTLVRRQEPARHFEVNQPTQSAPVEQETWKWWMLLLGV